MTQTDAPIKTFIITIITILLIVLTITVIRAQYVYDDKQIAPKPNSSATSVNISLDSALSRLSQAIKIKTISYDNPNQTDAQAFLDFHQHLKASFPLVHQQANKTIINNHSLIFYLKGQNPTLKPALFLAHIDVVPVDGNTLNQWQHPPYSGAITSNNNQTVVWGRGAMDDKGGLMALMEALEHMLTNKQTPARDIYFAFGHDEEVGGSQGAKKIAEYFKAQKLQFEFVLDEGGAITEGMMQGIDRPVALIGVAEKGFANIHLTVQSKGGHSSQPPNPTTIGILSQAITKLEQNPFPANLLFSEMTFDAIGSHAAFGSRLAMANLWLTEPLVKKVLLSNPKLGASLHTTMAATMIEGSPKSNVLPTKASAVVNVRIFPEQSSEQVQQRMQEIINDERVKLHRTMVSEPSPISMIENPQYQRIAGAIRALDSNILVAPYLVQGGTDSKYFYSLSDKVYRFLMVRVNNQTLSRIHGIDEQINAADYFNTIKFYHQILTRLN